MANRVDDQEHETDVPLGSKIQSVFAKPCPPEEADGITSAKPKNHEDHLTSVCLLGNLENLKKILSFLDVKEQVKFLALNRVFRKAVLDADPGLQHRILPISKERNYSSVKVQDSDKPRCSQALHDHPDTPFLAEAENITTVSGVRDFFDKSKQNTFPLHGSVRVKFGCLGMRVKLAQCTKGEDDAILGFYTQGTHKGLFLFRKIQNDTEWICRLSSRRIFSSTSVKMMEFRDTVYVAFFAGIYGTIDVAKIRGGRKILETTVGPKQSLSYEMDMVYQEGTLWLAMGDINHTIVTGLRSSDLSVRSRFRLENKDRKSMFVFARFLQETRVLIGAQSEDSLRLRLFTEVGSELMDETIPFVRYITHFFREPGNVFLAEKVVFSLTEDFFNEEEAESFLEVFTCPRSVGGLWRLERLGFRVSSHKLGQLTEESNP